MVTVFISNYYNHHQSSFCKEIYNISNGNFYFISTGKMSEWRKQQGYKEISDSFVYKFDERIDECNDLIKNADCAIIGSAPKEIIQSRAKTNRLTFIYSERIHKTKYNYLKLIKHIPQKFLDFGRYRNLYCLCASAFTAYDYSLTFTFLNKCYKWGYFPKTYIYNDECELLNKKKHGRISILFVSRLIKLKHPEYPLKLAKRIKEKGIPFQLNIIGIGELMDDCKRYVYENKLTGNVTFLGAMSTEDVRSYMEKTKIFLFTSDRNEGWGAVLNEAMNSGCSVVASSAIGAVPFLIKDGINGLVYKDGNYDDFVKKVERLITDDAFCDEIGLNAYRTIVNTWNAQNAAKAFIKLSEALLSNKKICISDGPCSKAHIIKDDWYDRSIY